jgi:hypothetical protein
MHTKWEALSLRDKYFQNFASNVMFLSVLYQFYFLSLSVLGPSILEQEGSISPCQKTNHAPNILMLALAIRRSNALHFLHYQVKLWWHSERAS